MSQAIFSLSMIVCCSRRCISSVSFFHHKLIGLGNLLSIGFDLVDGFFLFDVFLLLGGVAASTDGAIRGSDGELALVSNGDFLVLASVKNLEDVLAKALLLGLLDLAGLEEEFNFSQLVEIEQALFLKGIVLEFELLELSLELSDLALELSVGCCVAGTAHA